MAIGGGSGTSRLMGLGFMFGAKDKGAVKVTEEIGGGFDKMNDSVRQVGKQTTGLLRFGNAINALNFLQVNRLTDAMEGLADKAGLGDAAQANQIESWGIQFGKSYREATAGLGEFKEAVDEYKGAISGVSFTLEVDAGEMTKSIALITKSGYKLEDFGLNVRQVGGLMQSGILSGEQLADVLTSLAQGYDLGAEGAGKLMDEITSIGKVAGSGADAIRAMPEALKAADAAIAGLPEGMAGSVEDTVKSLTVLAASTQKVLGGPYEESFQAATDVMQMLTDSRKELARTFTGLGGEFPELTKRLAETYGSVDKAFEVMSDDPALFIQEVQKIYSNLDETRRFRLLEQLPDSIKFMVKAGAEGAKTIENMRGPIEGASGALGDMAKAASGSTRTFAERMELLEERFANRLNRMTSQTDAMVVKRQAKAWDRLGDTIDKLRAKGGPLSGLLQMFLDIRRHGFVHGILPSLEKLSGRGGLLGQFARWLHKVAPLTEGWGEGILDLVTSLGPMIIAFKYLGGFKAVSGVFSGLGSALSMVTPGMVVFSGLGLLIYKNWDLIQPMLEGIWGVLKKDLIPVFQEVKGVATELWTNVKAGVSIIWDDYLKPFGKWVYKNLPFMFASATESILGSVAYIQYGMRVLAIKAAASIEIMKAGWSALATIVEVKVLNAFDDVANVFRDLSTSWDLGFLKLRKWLSEIPLHFAEFIQTLAQKLPPKLVSFFGLEGTVKGIDATVKYYKKSSEEAAKALKDRLREKELMEGADEARRKDRELKVVKDLKKMDAAMRRHDLAVTDEKVELEKKLVEAKKAGAKVATRVSEAQASRGREIPKAEPRVTRRAKGKKTVEAARQEAAAVVAAEPFMVRARGEGAAEPLENFFKKQAFSNEGVKQLTGAFTQGIIDADKKRPRRPRGAAIGGSEPEG